MAARSSALLAVLAVAVAAAIGARDHIGYRDDGKEKGQEFSLELDQESGSGFKSKAKYLFGEFEVKMKLVDGNSAGTVTSFYLTSGESATHDEIDIEFMGNSSGDPYVMNTNVWASGDGKKEHQFYLWFDPSADFHTYKITWNPKNIIFEVDGVPVRTFKKYDGLPFPSSRPMTVHATLWDGSYWATQHGTVKIHWRHDPFVVPYKAYHANGCVHDKATNKTSCPAGSDAWMRRELGEEELKTVAWAERNCLSYNYCADGWRFPKGFPGECGRDL
ncbi:Xyloglucan endotransglycosylase/hydrolase protein 8 [Triticum urartu]|uniref:Xyloglucan endotransglucosylase/hydrolase n=1 Tax=Triticum urartu TaxID=4572 RepID=M7Z917_TRIUA|nr:Xyloglucan endotransglycosylase/hydrolase protein 8 [Triticum urartu]